MSFLKRMYDNHFAWFCLFTRFSLLLVAPWIFLGMLKYFDFVGKVIKVR